MCVCVCVCVRVCVCVFIHTYIVRLKSYADWAYVIYMLTSLFISSCLGIPTDRLNKYSKSDKATEDG